METQSSNEKNVERPVTRLIEFVLPALVPRRRREEVVGDFRQSIAYPREAIKEAADTLPVIVANEVQFSFKWKLVAAQAAVLYVAFAGATPPPPAISTIWVVLAAVVALVLRDAYTNPGEGAPGEAVFDGV